MAKKPTINSSLFSPTVQTNKLDVVDRIPGEKQEVTPVLHVSPVAHNVRTQPEENDRTHNTSTRIPIEIHRFFESLAEEHGYSTHSLRIFALARFVNQYQIGEVELKRDRSIRGKRVLEMPSL